MSEKAKKSSNKALDLLQLTAEDIKYEKDLLRNPYSVRHWLRYIDHKKSAETEKKNAETEKKSSENERSSEQKKNSESEKSSENEQQQKTETSFDHSHPVCTIYERAVLQLPMSYKLWHQYLLLRLQLVKDLCPASAHYEGINNTFERSLVFMHRMPRVWIMYCRCLIDQQKIARTRKVLDRALCALPITQHKRIWCLYLEFVAKHNIPETAVRVWRRYLKINPDDTEDYISYLLTSGRLAEAARMYEWCVNKESFVSKRGKSKYQLWSELCDLISNNPKETSLKNAEAIIRHGLQRYTDQTGRLWNCLAQYYINSSLFERARDVCEEALLSVMTHRDFMQVFDRYTQFEETLLEQQANNISGATDKQGSNMRLDRYADLLDRQKLMMNSVMLRQNPHNCVEWQKRVELYEGKPTMIINTYLEAVKTVDPKLAAGKLWQLWVSFGRYYENAGQLADARVILERATEVPYVKVDDLASVWCEYVEMELRNSTDDTDALARQVLRRATAAPSYSVSYHDNAESVQKRVHKSLKLWSLYADVEETVGSFASCRAVYERIIDLRIASPEIVLNYAEFLREHNYFEESFRAYEKGIALFKWDYVFDIWNSYLVKFLERYKGTRIERMRDLFEQCLEKCPAKYSKTLYLLYAQMEEKYGLARRVLKVYEAATKAVLPDEKLEMYNAYIQHADSIYGIARTRAIYQEAIEDLPNNGARDMCLRFAETERLLGEIDRAREIYVYGSQISDPRLTADYWSAWNNFEVQHGNEETMKELLRIKRSVQAKYSTASVHMAGQLTAAPPPPSPAGEAAVDSMQQLEADAKKTQPSVQPQPGAKILFVRGEVSQRDIEVADSGRVANPDEINIDTDDEEDEEELPAAKEVPKEVFGGLQQ